jgi:hypothetical protein
MVLKFASYTQAVVSSSEVCVMRGHNRKIRKSSVSIKNDEDGSVEGMPLYMMIMVVVVVVSIGILVGIMGGFKGQNLGTLRARASPPPPRQMGTVVRPSVWLPTLVLML